jgi:hypothetical protein
MKYLSIFVALLSSQSFGWECNDPNGYIKKEGVLVVKKVCDTELCQFTIEAPHSLEDRAFQDFTLSQEHEGKPIFVAPLQHKQMGAVFSTEITIKKSKLSGFSVMANYLNFGYGCTAGSTVYLEKT